MSLDLSQFYETFFDEADELLAQMEGLLLGLDVCKPDTDALNAIFRAAHSIKGGASTFGCFGLLADTTHLLENLLDAIRTQTLALRRDMVDVFLQTRDVLADQVAAYRSGTEPDTQAAQAICERLKALNESTDAASASAPANPEPAPPASEPASDAQGDATVLHITLKGIADKDAQNLLTEMALMGQVQREQKVKDGLQLWLRTSASCDDIKAVCGFVVNDDQVTVAPAQPEPAQLEPTQPEPSPVADRTDKADSTGKQSPDKASGKSASSAATAASSTLRVGVEKVDQIINLVGELVITQAMLQQSAALLDVATHGHLLNGIEHLERNARDLQEAVMSIRMIPMEYVFSRFPRVVRENAARMGKQIELTTQGAATELDKSLIERIIDPLTHLVRNSMDHGIETPEVRRAAGKPERGQLRLAARHVGGQIIIEVSDDGAGLNRQRILDKALRQGLPVNANMPDEELWQVIFAPGFSTADQVTEISGRGVGMDVVKRNIQSLGGQVLLSSTPGQGTCTRIALPLTLAILDGMLVQVGAEIFVLPLTHVVESMQVNPGQLHSMPASGPQTGQVLHVRGEYLPVLCLGSLLAVPELADDTEHDAGAVNAGGAKLAVILQAGDNRFALLIDQLVGQRQVVVKSLQANYRRVPGISAATILGDGNVALIVDVMALQQMTCPVYAAPDANPDANPDVTPNVNPDEAPDTAPSLR